MFIGNRLRGLVLVGGLLLIAGCDDGPPRSVVDPELAASEADYIIFGLKDYLSRNGIREAIVEADTAFVFQDSTIVLLRGNVTLTAYHEGLGTEKALVTSDRGRMDTTSNELLAEGNAVLLIRADGKRIESYQLRYMPDVDMIRSDSATVMYDGEDVVEGTGFTSDLSFESIRVLDARTRRGAVRF